MGIMLVFLGDHQIRNASNKDSPKAALWKLLPWVAKLLGVGNVSLERLGAHILVKVQQFVGHQGFGYENENQGFLWICVGC